MSAPAGLRDWSYLIFLGIIWGASFLGVSLALEGFGPLTVAAGRIALGALILVAMAIGSGKGLPKTDTAKGRRIWLHSFGFAIFTNAVPFGLLSWAQQHVSSGFAGITMAVVPLFVLPLARIVLKEELTVVKIIGFLLGFVGVLILIGPDALGGVGSMTENIARFACVGASLCYAIGTMITRTAPKGSLISYSAAGLLLGAMMIVPIALMIEGIPAIPDFKSSMSLLYLGIFPTALATILLVRVINSAGPSFLSTVNYQVPIWAVIFGLVFLKEALPPTFLSALALILLGLAISQAKAWRFRL